MRLLIFMLLVCGSLQAQISRSILQDSVTDITVVQDSVTGDWTLEMFFYDGVYIQNPDTSYVPNADSVTIDTVITPIIIDTVTSSFTKTFSRRINMRSWISDLRSEFDGEIGAANIRIEKYLFDRQEAVDGLNRAREDKRKAQDRRSDVNDLITEAFARPASTIILEDTKPKKKKKKGLKKWFSK